jgi:hypothetical protein
MTISKSKRQRQLEQRRFLRLIDIISTKYTISFKREIQKTMNKLADSYNLNNYISESILLDHKKSLQKILMRLYSDSIESISEKQFNSIKKSRNIIYEKKDALQDFEELSIDYILKKGADLSVQLTDTTRKDVQNIIAEGIKDNLSSKEIAKFIKEKAGISRSRAELISRTEVHSSANWASIESTQSISNELNIEFKKVWNTTEDERTRSSHRKADGQKVDMDESFLVNDEKLMYPGDSSGSASNVINCRCFLTYE